MEDHTLPEETWKQLDSILSRVESIEVTLNSLGKVKWSTFIKYKFANRRRQFECWMTKPRCAKAKEFPARLSCEYRGEVVYSERQWGVYELIYWLIGPVVWHIAFM